MEIDPIESDTAAATYSTSRNRFSHKKGDTRRGGSIARSLHEYPIMKTLSPKTVIPFDGIKKNFPSSERARSDSLTSTSERDSYKHPQKKLEHESQGILKRSQSSTRLESTPIKSAINSQEKEKVQMSEPVQVITSSEPNTNTTKWECEHCTFVNDHEARICAICCKTSIKILETLPPSPPEIITELEQRASEQLEMSATDQQNSSALIVKEGRKDRKITFARV